MDTETERRFLVRDLSIVSGAQWQLLTQAYVFTADSYAIRVRLVQEQIDFSADVLDRAAFLTGKGPDFGFGTARKREEYEVPVSPLWARQVIDRSDNVVTKRRYHLLSNEAWDVDEFLEDNEGLCIAELEGGDQVGNVALPSWASRDVSKDPRFDNDQLALRPWNTWPDEERQQAYG